MQDLRGKVLSFNCSVTLILLLQKSARQKEENQTLLQHASAFFFPNLNFID